jgi:hypothetical protein
MNLQWLRNRPIRESSCPSGRFRVSMTWVIRAFLLILWFGLNPSSANASLGGDTASIMSDANALGAVKSPNSSQGIQTQKAPIQAVQSYVLRTSTGEKYTYSEFATASQYRVREFLTPDGKVFGVAWQGPRAPDLHALLGAHFAEWRDAARSQPQHSLHHSEVRTSSVVVEMGGPMGFVVGRAWAPNLVPDGVDARNVVK